MQDLRATALRVIRFLLKLMVEKTYGTLEIQLQAGMPTNVKFVQNWKPQQEELFRLPQTSEREEASLIGPSRAEGEVEKGIGAN